ncbi:glycolipid transfer protein [Chloropicon primus]|uniref:Glycolipid transfer protein n=1 Tax=Chloropicon primus TaxID=1764295 RepID=A0A5B8MSR4_9CHLO|nr:glycolipid transfer protein [Chloropicon primus]UPR03031.1 glycolipid transfer protein [Chloropicon primus]|mmetsp:Transcript_9579/g.27320  ORF Transcript_9579/g.27320 Transcript_9579/m.27320 type:complete len:210 (+) Transcript_9579:307-936(+)|eukprot:QDZ23818.1 glycolipid transfer protein [Chloropicon primus]
MLSQDSSSSSSVFSVLLGHVGQVDDGKGGIRTQAFLNVCREVLPVVDKLGAGFTVVRIDVNGNVDRIHKRFVTSAEEYENIYAILEGEVQRNEQTGNSSCTKGLLWLKRAMQFLVELLHILHQDKSSSVSDAANAAYEKVLQPYHGWITSGVFWGALKLVPSRETLYANLGQSATLEEDMGSFIAQFGAVLSKVHDYMDSHGLNFPDKV